jgi:Transposase and inactivated derivatives, IS5 family
MHQPSFSDIEYGLRKRTTKREEFLKAMDDFIPWDEWVSLITPYYPSGGRGRPPMGVEKMLRMYLLQCWFNLSDEGIEDAIYDSYALRSFMKINFVDEQTPDATTLLNFRHLLERHGIAKKFFQAFNGTLEKCGYLMRGGSIVDATLIRAPSSTKNAKKQRDPEMCQTKKGNQYYFGMKCHSGVDAGSGYVHSLEVTAANIHDITVATKLIRDDDEVVYGDAGYLGMDKREEVSSDKHLSSIDYRINRRVGSVQKVPDGFINWEKIIERRKSSVRSKVEHPFLIVKRFFGYSKTVYKGLAKNGHRLYMLFTSANLLMCIRAGRPLPA